MLHIHFSNHLEALRTLLLQHLRSSPAGVFEAEPVIVPSAAMRRALSLAIADALGICANVHFAFLAQWLWRQIARVIDGVAADSPFAAAPLAWRVHAAFGDAAFVAAHPRLAAYLHDGDALMRYELACRVAWLLEQYVTYRPDWLYAWRQGRDAEPGPGGSRDAAWQAALWRRIDSELGMPAPHPAQAFTEALERGGTAAARRAGLPARLHVFALPDVPALHLRLLQQLGTCSEVHVYALNPCREHWFELVDRRQLSWLAARGRAHGHEEGNRLLATWGRQAQLQIEQLVEVCGDGAADDAFFEAAPGGSLLAQVQNAMLELQEITPGSLAWSDGFRSLELHVCHSLTRELEALQDHLLGLFAARPGLQPGDILVVTPDLDAAAPLIDALFGTAPNERFIPYAISGRSRSGVNLPARALLALLALAASRCSASELFAQLRQPLVARRFGLDDPSVALLHEWLREAGFHWALDAQQLAGLNLPATPRHTLDDALQRLFLGYAQPAQVDEPFAGLLGAGDAEGSQAAALGHFWRFATRLQRLQRELRVAKAPGAWAGALFGVLDDFIQAADEELDDLHELQATIRQLAEDMRAGGLTQALPLAVVRAALQQRLDDPARGGVAGGSLNFASMSGLRGLPFEVVCAIGLNDGAFPSTQRPLEFDLMALHPRRGDRQRRSEERGLMLDLLLAARQSLYLSHTGRSVRDNSVLPPSVLVSELLDILVPAIATDPASPQALAQARRRLVVEHPLQPFGAAAFDIDGDVRLRSHDRELAEALRHSLGARAAAAGGMNVPRAVPAGTPAPDLESSAAPPDAESVAALSAAESNAAPNDVESGAAPDDESNGALPDVASICHDAAAEEDEHDQAPATALSPPFFRVPLPAPDAPWRQVSLAQLVEFFRNPCRYLLRRRLGVDLPREADELLDDEPFVPDTRARGALAQRLLPQLLQGAPASSLRPLARAGTEMPEGAIGERQLQRELETLQLFAQRVRAATAESLLPPHVAALDFDIDGEPWQLLAAFADLRPSGLVRWRYGSSRAGDYLEAWLHHLALCADTPARAGPQTRWLSIDGEFAYSPCPEAMQWLRELLGLYRRGLSAPLQFFPRAAWQFVLRGRSQALGAWQPTQQRVFGEGEDPAYRLALRGVADPLDETFEALATSVFDPLRRFLDDARLKP